MMFGIILFGFFTRSFSADGVADVVLSCDLVEEGVGLGGMGGGVLFTRTPATLVLKDVPVGPDESLETLTPFVPPSVPDPELLLFETKVSSPEIPKADVLLHADCNQQEVLCEISRYSPRGLQDSSGFFMVSLSVDGVDFSTSLILQTLPVEQNPSTLVQSKLGLPLSGSGTLLTEVMFLVFSHVQSVSAPLKAKVLLNCGFRQQEVRLGEEVGVEWRLQHRGKGRKVLEMKTKLDGSEGSSVVLGQREGSSLDAALLLREGDASMTLSRLQVEDEGTYICTISVGNFHAQQVVQLLITQAPQVSLSEGKKDSNSAQTFSCHCSNYYPLDVQMEWFSLPPTASEPEPFIDQGSLTSHRQHGDGTFSLSSHLSVPSAVPPGTKITCRVSHLALDAPLQVTVEVQTPEPGTDVYILDVSSKTRGLKLELLVRQS
ncbi:tapasin-related protein [Amphiprion ocellaris]|uniref:tapasin-related protein n=1 Tax=Amphiprion ocellaris TaxID=80972 RepID=UPI000C306D68|nr:tapasin-related protein [Amphiprion ocellaris]